MTERNIAVTCALEYQMFGTTDLLLQIEALPTQRQTIVSQSFQLSPEHPLNRCRIGPLKNQLVRLHSVSQSIRIDYQAVVALQPQNLDPQLLHESNHSQLPTEVLPYLNPSRYCESDLLGKFAADTFINVMPGYWRVQQIADWVFNSLSYSPGSTGSGTTACDVLLQRSGVCRDFAHVCIALCRALGIPARYVAAYAVNLQPPDFHGFFEAWLGNDWIPFDATRLAPINGFVRIGAGRDAADVAFATLIGQANLVTMHVLAQDIDYDNNNPTPVYA